MDTNTFIAAVRALPGIPEAQKVELVRVAADLPPDQREYILIRLSSLNADLTKNDQKYASSLRRVKMMTDQVEQTDMPALRKLTDA